MQSKPSAQSHPSSVSELPEMGGGLVCTLGGRNVMMLPHDSTRLTHSFLGHAFCQRAFAALTGVNILRSAKLMTTCSQSPRRPRQKKLVYEPR